MSVMQPTADENVYATSVTTGAKPHDAKVENVAAGAAALVTATYQQHHNT